MSMRRLILLLFYTLPAAVYAQFDFVTNNGQITITRYTGPGGDVTIPSTTNGFPVTGIGAQAFYKCTSLTNATLPDTLISIGSQAFWICANLKNALIPNSVTTLGDYAFQHCSNLTSVTIGNAVTNIPNSAFSYCGSLSVLILGNSVTNFGSRAFYRCVSLTNVELPVSVARIGGDAFELCTNLIAFTVVEANPVLSSLDGVVVDKTHTTLVKIPPGRSGNYTIGTEVTNIANSAFSYCNLLSSVTIPNSVTSIPNYAFWTCSSLTNATMSDGVASIGVAAFYTCTSLTTVTIPSSVTNIGASAFDTCISLQSVWIPDSVTSIANAVFNGCSGLATVSIPDRVTTIGSASFSGCGNLRTVTIPDSVTSIGGSAFDSCTSLTNATISKYVTNIGFAAFRACTSLTAITVDELNPAYMSLDGVLFSRSPTILCQYPAGKVGNYRLPSSATAIANDAFWGCSALTTVTIPASVTWIADRAFGTCSLLTGVYFEGNAPATGYYLFYWDEASTVYYLPGTTGWTTTFVDRPTALWLPQVQSGDAVFGVRTNQFGFNISWASEKVVVVEACANLGNPSLFPVGTNTLTNGSSYFSDPAWTNYPSRFYRLRSP